MGSPDPESKITAKPQKTGKPFFQDMPYQALMVPSKVTRSKVMSFPLQDVFLEFYERIKREEGDINLRILGIALQSAAKLHRSRVTGLISYKRKWDSQDEKLEEKLAEKEQEKERKKRKRKKQPLKQYMEDPLEADSEEFYDALLTAMKRDEKRRKKKRQSLLLPSEAEDIDEEDEKVVQKTKRRRRIKIEKLKDFEGVQIDRTRANVDVLINEVREAILALCTAKITEISFVDILRKKIELTQIDLSDSISWKLEQIRIFMSLLYLVREGYIEAYQDLDTGEITVEAKKSQLEKKFELQDEDATTL